MNGRRLWLALGLGAVALAGCGGSSTKSVTTQTAANRLPPHARVVFASDKPVSIGHVNSVHVAGTTVASIPFDPQRDGFSFENYTFIAGLDQLNPHVMRRLFGDVVCATAPSDDCTLTTAAQQWAAQSLDIALGGHCYGFSATALRFFTHRLDPNQFGGPTPYSLAPTAPLLEEVAYGFAMQSLPSVYGAQLIGTPSEIISDLERALRNPSAEVYTLSIRNSYGPGSEGHAVTPFAVVDQGGDGKFQILIYDNNKPGTTQAVAVDTKAQTWSYNLATNAVDPSSLWHGQGSDNPMRLEPTFPGLGPQPCPFCAHSFGGGSDRVSLAGDPVTHGHLLIVSHGRRLGYVGGRFVNEIRGARVILPALTQDWRAHPEPLYEVPAGTKLTITLVGAGGSGAQPATVHITGPGFGATVSNLVLGPHASGQIQLAPDASAISLRLAGSATRQRPTVALARDRGRAGHELVLTPTGLAAGAQIGLAATGRAARVTSSDTSSPVRLTVRTVNAAGSRTVSHTGTNFSTSL